MSKLSPYEVKEKSYRLDKNDATLVEITFTVKGPTVCAKKFSDKAEAQRECDMLNEVYNKGHQDGVKLATPQPYPPDRLGGIRH